MIKINLSKLLGERRMNQADLARKTKIRPSAINEMYWGLSKYLNIDYINRICGALKCSVGELIEYIPDDKQGGK